MSPAETRSRLPLPSWGCIVAGIAFLLIVPCVWYVVTLGLADTALRKSVNALSHGHQVAVGLLNLMNDQNQIFPDFSKSNVLASKLEPYLTNPEVLPVAREAHYNHKLSGRNCNLLLNREDVWMVELSFSDGDDRFPVCFADARCTLLSAANLAKVQAVNPRWAPEPARRRA